ncbi:unnamed protein product, partial [Prorocentrum cordatum]
MAACDPEAEGGAEDETEDAVDGTAEAPRAGEGETLSSQEQLLQMLRRSRLCEESRRQQDRQHAFWDTQPVPSMSSEYSSEAGPIDELKKPDDVRDDPYPLPAQFEWCTSNVDSDQEMQE